MLAREHSYVKAAILFGYDVSAVLMMEIMTVFAS